MEKSEVISPEIEVLFDKVRSQAIEYSNAFQSIERLIVEFQNEKEEFLNSTVKLRSDVYGTLDLLQKNVQESIELIETKAEKTIRIYDDLDSISKVKDSLFELQSKLNEQSEEFQTLISKYSSKAKFDFEYAWDNYKSKVDKKLDLFSKKLEIKLSHKLNNLESNLLSYNQKLWSFSEQQTKDFRLITDEIDDIKNSGLDLNKSVNDFKHKIEKQLKEFEDQFDAKVSELGTVLLELRKLKKELKPENFIKNSDYEDDIHRINQKTKTLSDTINKIEKRGSTTLVLTIISLMLIAVFLIIYLTQ